jgi:hypothetical protein
MKNPTDVGQNGKMHLKQYKNSHCLYYIAFASQVGGFGLK